MAPASAWFHWSPEPSVLSPQSVLPQWNKCPPRCGGSLPPTAPALLHVLESPPWHPHLCAFTPNPGLLRSCPLSPALLGLTPALWPSQLTCPSLAVHLLPAACSPSSWPLTVSLGPLPIGAGFASSGPSRPCPWVSVSPALGPSTNQLDPFPASARRLAESLHRHAHRQLPCPPPYSSWPKQPSSPTAPWSLSTHLLTSA